MSQTEQLRSACTGMAAYLAFKLTDREYDPTSVVEPGEAITGWAISTSETAENVLCHDLDLIGPKDFSPRSLLISTDAFADHFASGRYDRAFPALFAAYVDFVHWRNEVPTTRRAFQAPPRHAHILRHLAGLGYLRQSGDGIRWTDKAATAMVLAAAWHPDDHRAFADR